MKIIINENQFNMLTEIKENKDFMNQVKVQYNELNKKINKLFSDVNFISIAELINGEVNVSDLSSSLNEFDSSLVEWMGQINNFMDSKSDEDYDNNWSKINDQLDNLYYKLSDKIKLIQTVVSAIEPISNSNLNVSKVFSDIGSSNL